MTARRGGYRSARTRHASPPYVPATHPERDLLLLGGGHSHVQVLRALGMRPVPGLQITLVAREAATPYSGMLPGHIAGCYSHHDIHIDLRPLCRFAGVRLVVDEAVALDPDAGNVAFAHRPPLHFDLLSVNTGGAPQAPAGSRDAAAATPAVVPDVSVGPGIPVKPIGRFLPRWEAVRKTLRAGQRVVLVGGGAGGVELALAMRRVLPAGIRLDLVTDTLLPGFPAAAVTRLQRALAQAGVHLQTGFHVAHAAAGPTPEGAALVADDGRMLDADVLFRVTGVSAPEWIAASGLATDSGGFLLVDACLRSVSHPQVFAAGDVAALCGQPRPKAGVYAVREGPVLGVNLVRALHGQPLRRFRAQRHHLAIIGTGDGHAVAVRGGLTVAGRWVRRWKDRIDRRFIARFRDLPQRG